jgi:hypothetical protein
LAVPGHAVEETVHAGRRGATQGDTLSLRRTGDSTRYQKVYEVFVRVNLCLEFCILKTI